MVVLVGVVLAALALYVWLAGHWYGRWLVFLPMAAIFGVIFKDGALHSAAAGGALFFGAIGIVVAWFVSGLPLYWHRARARDVARAQAMVVQS